MPVEWIAVANRSRVRLFHWLRETTPQYMEIGEWECRDARLPGQSLETDRPGRYRLPGKPTSAFESPAENVHAAAGEFAKEFVQYLDQARHERRFDTVILIAEPIMLGELRRHLPSALKPLVAREFNKDLVQLPQSDLFRHLHELLSVEQPV